MTVFGTFKKVSFPVSAVHDFFWSENFRFFYAVFRVEICWFQTLIYMSIYKKKMNNIPCSANSGGGGFADWAAKNVIFFDALPERKHNNAFFDHFFAALKNYESDGLWPVL